MAIPRGRTVDVTKLNEVKELHDTLVANLKLHKGVGLAAVQLGIPSNACVIKYYDHALCLINCSYSGIGKPGKEKEGCLSLPGETWEVPRYDKIWLRGYVYNPGQHKVFKVEKHFGSKIVHLEGSASDIAQHEIDHQLGILISDIGTKVE